MTKRQSLILHMFHGRNHPEEKLDNWGFDGPVLRIEGFHVTYLTTFRIAVPEQVDPTQDWHDLTFVDDLLYYGGKYYGDWSIHAAGQEPTLEAHAEDVNIRSLTAPIPSVQAHGDEARCVMCNEPLALDTGDYCSDECFEADEEHVRHTKRT